MIPPRSSAHLIWVDLEFTNLEPTTSYIMQAALIITTADLQPVLPPNAPADQGGLLFDVALHQAQADTASEWVRANQAEQLQRSLGPEATPLAQVESSFVDYLQAVCDIPAEKRDRPVLAGNSVHGDARLLTLHMPAFDELLSFRIIDVSSLKELTRRWCPDLEFRKTDDSISDWYPGHANLTGTTHDALYDIKASIAELNYYRQNLLVPAAR